ncbi:unnamed protein product [Orchesella dallaii]|uniref:Uncharacterized protein n=1 Tax=Orchesella dallaii TaxID=48710 RepID=A0ABP1RJM8_9HEXA
MMQERKNRGKFPKFLVSGRNRRTLLVLLLFMFSETFVSGRPDRVQVQTGSYDGVLKETERNIPEYIQSSILKYCEKCSETQRKTVEDVLLLLFSLNPDEQGEDKKKDAKFKEKLKKTMMKNKFKVTTSNPRDRWPSVPAPELAEKYYFGGGNVIAFPTISTTPSLQVNNFSLSLSSTTVSSAPAPAQSVEMPTPPLPPTTMGPIYFYYQKATGISSSSLQPPTTSGVVESSLVEKRGTTLQP